MNRRGDGSIDVTEGFRNAALQVELVGVLQCVQIRDLLFGTETVENIGRDWIRRETTLGPSYPDTGMVIDPNKHSNWANLPIMVFPHSFN
jgi:hypothetical protein